MYFCILLQEEEWARQEALRIQQQEDEEAAKRAALQPPPASDQRYDLPPEVCLSFITNYGGMCERKFSTHKWHPIFRHLV